MEAVIDPKIMQINFTTGECSGMWGYMYAAVFVYSFLIETIVAKNINSKFIQCIYYG
jgi:hypothetical protein